MKHFIPIIILSIMLIGCKKDDDSSSSATSIPTTGTGTIASGTITDASNLVSLTGEYSHSWYGAEPSGGCIDNSTFLSLMQAPSDTLGMKNQVIITSSTTFTRSQQWYSDAACTTIIGYFNTGYNETTISDAVSGLTAGSAPTKPTSAYKITYKDQAYGLMGSTDATIAKFTAMGLTVESGVEKLIDETSITTYYSIVNTGTVTGSDSSYLFFENASSSAYPTDWTSNMTTYWK